MASSSMPALGGSLDWSFSVSSLFNAKDADFILCSEADYLPTHFKVHKAKLSLSPVFDNMLACGNGSGTGSAGDSKPDQELPVVVLPEPRQVVEVLLRFLYNDTAQLAAVFASRLKNFEGAFYEACFKYEMPYAALLAEVLFSQALASLTLANLLECYGTAARFDRIDFKEACAKLIIGRTTDPSTWPEATVSRLSSHSVLALMTAREKSLKRKVEYLTTELASAKRLATAPAPAAAPAPASAQVPVVSITQAVRPVNPPDGKKQKAVIHSTQPNTSISSDSDDSSSSDSEGASSRQRTTASGTTAGRSKLVAIRSQ